MKTINRFLKGITLLWIISSVGCASLATSSLPALENRTLDLHPNIPGFIYKYETCVKRVLGICIKKDLKVIEYDLRDEETRKKLFLMGFVGKVREKH